MHVIRVYSFLLILLISSNLFAATAVIKYPESGESLPSRWSWALKKAEGGDFKKGFWVVYTFKRFMSDNESIGEFGDDRVGPTLMEILTGIRPPGRDSGKTVKEEAKRLLAEAKRQENKNWQDVAVLVQYERSKNISKIKVSTMGMIFSFKDLPVIWLGSAENQQSIELLKTLYQHAKVTKRKEELIAPIALHQSPDLVIPFLSGVVTGEQDTELRKSAVFWLGQTHDPGALKFLLKVVNTAAAELRKSAVFSISQMRLPEANQALIDLARQKENREARLEAIFWISQQGFHQAPKILEQIALQESDEEVRQKAVFSISQLKRQLGIPMLISIATNHKVSATREEAIFWLGQIGGKAEGEMLEKIARQDPNGDVRKKAIFSISQMKKDISILHLERIAKTHQEKEMRKEAIFWLGQMKDPRAKNVLLQILKN